MTANEREWAAIVVLFCLFWAGLIGALALVWGR